MLSFCAIFENFEMLNVIFILVSVFQGTTSGLGLCPDVFGPVHWQRGELETLWCDFKVAYYWWNLSEYYWFWGPWGIFVCMPAFVLFPLALYMYVYIVGWCMGWIPQAYVFLYKMSAVCTTKHVLCRRDLVNYAGSGRGSTICERGGHSQSPQQIRKLTIFVT